MKPYPADQRLAAVKEFHTTFDVLMVRSFVDCSNSQAILRGELVREEFAELSNSTSRVDALDAYVDLEYIAAGSQLALALKVARVTANKPLAFYAQRCISECNKSQLCQRGLVNSFNGLRAAIEAEATKAFKDFHGAFMAVHENNMKKMWSETDMSIASFSQVIPTGSKHTRQNNGLFIVKRADGKILKPPGHPKPDIAQFV